MGMGNQVEMDLPRCCCHLGVPSWPDPWLFGHVFVGRAYGVAMLALQVGSSTSSFTVTSTRYCPRTTVEISDYANTLGREIGTSRV